MCVFMLKISSLFYLSQTKWYIGSMANTNVVLLRLSSSHQAAFVGRTKRLQIYYTVVPGAVKRANDLLRGPSVRCFAIIWIHFVTQRAVSTYVHVLWQRQKPLAYAWIELIPIWEWQF